MEYKMLGTNSYNIFGKLATSGCKTVSKVQIHMIFTNSYLQHA